MKKYSKVIGEPVAMKDSVSQESQGKELFPEGSKKQAGNYMF